MENVGEKYDPCQNLAIVLKSTPPRCPNNHREVEEKEEEKEEIRKQKPVLAGQVWKWIFVLVSFRVAC